MSTARGKSRPSPSSGPIPAPSGNRCFPCCGSSRQELRAGEGCPWALEPLIELMFRGSFWLQRNGRDWTLAGDQATKAALSRALAEVGSVPLDQLRGKRLEAQDFNAYLVPDAIRDLLRWMADPPGLPAALQPRAVGSTYHDLGQRRTVVGGDNA